MVVSVRDRVIKDLHNHINDNVQAWKLQPDGSYQRAIKADGAETVSAQQSLLDQFAENTRATPNDYL